MNFSIVNMTLSDKARSDIHWWISNAHLSNKVINHGSIDLVISADASLLGWGASLGQKNSRGSMVCRNECKNVECRKRASHKLLGAQSCFAWLTVVVQ